MQYQLLNGCPALVLPAKPGAPLLAWDTLTLESLWRVALPESDAAGARSKDGKFEGIVGVVYEFLDLCVDWERFVLGSDGNDTPRDTEEGHGEDDGKKREALKAGVEVLVAAAVRSGASKEVKEQVDKERSGIAIWRIP